MKAVMITAHGGNDVVQVRNCPRPQRRTGEVLIRMAAGTLNQVDLYMRNSGAGITHSLPLIMGLDGAGTVEEADADEPVLRPGCKVVIHPSVSCGRCEYCRAGQTILCTHVQIMGEHCDGSFAQWTSVPASNVFPLPEHLDFMQGAALGVNHLTAWRMLFTRARVKPWETVLIFGIGGGVSLAALQLVTAMGARAIVTSRDDAKLERAHAMGAELGINSKTSDVARTVLAHTGGRGVDVVIENVGAAVWSAALRSLARNGRLVTCGATTGSQPPADLQRIFVRQLQIMGSTHGTLAEFHELLNFVRHHAIVPVIDQRFTMDDIHAALSRLESGEQFGKVGISLAG